MKTIQKVAPLWMVYVVLFALSALGPVLSFFSGLARGHWAFLFYLPFALGSIPLSFLMGEVIQRRTRASARFAWRTGVLHIFVFWAIFLIGMFDFLVGTREVLYYTIWLVPSVLSGLFLVLGMHVMRVEQAHSDARYGVEVRRGDPWASFFDLTWETDKGHGTRSGRRGERPSSQRGSRRQRSASRQGETSKGRRDGSDSKRQAAS